MTRFVRILEVDPPRPPVHIGVPGRRLVLSRGGDGDPYEIYLSDEVVLPEQVRNPDARNVKTEEMVFLDQRQLEWLHKMTGELLAAIADEDKLTLDGIPQHEPTPVEEIAIDHKFDDGGEDE